MFNSSYTHVGGCFAVKIGNIVIVSIQIYQTSWSSGRVVATVPTFLMPPDSVFNPSNSYYGTTGTGAGNAYNGGLLLEKSGNIKAASQSPQHFGIIMWKI